MAGAGIRVLERLRFTVHFALAAWCVIALLPLYFTVVSALKSEEDYQRDPWGLPSAITFANFQKLFDERGFAQLFINSFIVTSATIVIALCFCVPAAYSLARMKFPGNRVVLTVNNALMAVPVVVILIPEFILMARLHLVNTYFAAIIIYVGLAMPWSVYLLTRFFERIPSEVLDAAVVDGCGDLGLLFRVIVPLSGPAIATVAVTNFIWVWNELLIALVFLQDNSVRTLMPGVMAFFSRFTWQPTLIMAALCLVVLPVIGVYLFSYRVFIAGVGEGMGK